MVVYDMHGLVGGEVYNFLGVLAAAVSPGSAVVPPLDQSGWLGISQAASTHPRTTEQFASQLHSQQGTSKQT